MAKEREGKWFGRLSASSEDLKNLKNCLEKK
jgi:hypothetical protein